ncbi:NUDIX domain-containing protein, partial [Candidatus Micrarchaeota archaeon]|nr:NUDIX domain-containing protein [Candidatus Micrarchaeota archaeon]
GERKVIEFFWRESIPSFNKRNFNVKEETRHVSFIDFNGFCPIIKACLKNGLDPETVCMNCCEKPFNAVLKEFEENSEFRVVNKRHKGKCCEYMIVFRPKKVNETVNAFVMNKERLLLLKRINGINNYPGKWNVVAGYLNEMNPLKRIYMEIEEETGIKKKDLRLVKKVKQFRLKDNVLGKTWIVNAFLFETGKRRVKLNWEHSDFKWVKPEELKKFDSVFGLDKAVKKAMN